MAKVYISCHHSDPANELADKLLAAGHEVTSTWHRETDPRPDLSDELAWVDKATANFDRIAESDALALIASPDHLSGAKRVAGGKFVEAGYAFGAEVNVFTVGGTENGMMHAACELDDADQLLAVLTEQFTEPTE